MTLFFEAHLTTKGWKVMFKYYSCTRGFNKRHGTIVAQFFSIQFSDTKWFLDCGLDSVTKIVINAFLKIKKRTISLTFNYMHKMRLRPI